ncbi:MAG: arginine--tRNA ligase [Thermoplasmata archaeon]|nr:MAG: arginine--tRNA ligase [Thermoplasmata archaeon]
MDYPIYECRKEIISALENVLSRLKYDCKIKLEIPPEGMGDFAFPCFSLASIVKKPPNGIAKKIADMIEKNVWIDKVDTQGGYVNFFIDTKHLINSTLKLILEKKEEYGKLHKKNKKVIIEHTSANPNGPLHVGRARNPIIGDTLVRIFRAAGYSVESQYYLDDMGKQVAILTWGINNLDQNDVPKQDRNKPDHRAVGFYQKANELMEKNEKIAKEINEIIKRCEQGDSKTIEMIQRAYSPVLMGIKESLQHINIKIDRFVPESMFVRDKSVDSVVKKLRETRYCHEQDGAFYLDLKTFGIQGRNTRFFFTRKDGTTLYATRDIAYHLWKAKQADILINVLGEDHKLESKQVEIALKLLNAKTLPKAIFYAFVSLPEGKMSTRKGRVIYLDDLIDESIERAYLEVKKRREAELSEKKMKKIAEIVGIGCLRYNIIKIQPEKDIIFKWEEALNFEGNAVPFIQYAHARACSILLKGKNMKKKLESNVLNHTSEIQLIKQLARLPLVIEEASISCKPHIITTYLYETASRFNQFYRDCPVLPEKNKVLQSSRLNLVDATRIVLKNGLDLLGITAPEEM